MAISGGRRLCGPRAEESTVHGGRLIRVKGPPCPTTPGDQALWNLPALRTLAATQPFVSVRSLVLHSDQMNPHARPVLSLESQGGTR